MIWTLTQLVRKIVLFDLLEGLAIRIHFIVVRIIRRQAKDF